MITVQTVTCTDKFDVFNASAIIGKAFTGAVAVGRSRVSDARNDERGERGRSLGIHAAEIELFAGVYRIADLIMSRSALNTHTRIA